MKNGIRWGVVFIPLLACAQMSVSTTERVTTEVAPDVLVGTLGFEEMGSESDRIKTDMNALVAEIKRFDPDGRYCRGGGYQISPRYTYKNQKQEFAGYAGTMGLSCEFQAIEQYNALNAAITPSLTPQMRIRLSPLQWQVSRAKEQKVSEGLRTALMRKISQSAAKLSEDTQMVCEPATVRIGQVPSVMPMRMLAGAAAMESVPTESPLRSSDESVLEGSVEYRCLPKAP